MCLPKTAYNGFGLGEGSDFSTNVDAENQTLINHKCVCGTLNRQFAKPVLVAVFICLLSNQY
ncbi:MAG: hypothetical protein EBT39_05250 [Sphingobacteriia bacterium]|nr:hypothetical protein [Candidatus Fonsibacter lacus]